MKVDFIYGQIATIPQSNRSYESGYVNVIVGFNNPGLPVNLDSTISGATNTTAGVVSGFLSSVVPWGTHVLNMSFYVPAWVGNGTINQFFSFTRYTAFYNAVSDPRIFSQTIAASSPIHDYRKVNDTANYMPVVIAYLF